MTTEKIEARMAEIRDELQGLQQRAQKVDKPLARKINEAWRKLNLPKGYYK